MKFKLQLVTELECGESKTVADIFTIERGELCAENLGLKLDEAKQILEVIQRTIVQKQVENFEKTQKQCLQCSSFKKSKGFYPLTFRSLFGNVRLDCQRLFHCACSELEANSVPSLNFCRNIRLQSLFTWRQSGRRLFRLKWPQCCSKIYCR
jgi:hypothetical protein